MIDNSPVFASCGPSDVAEGYEAPKSNETTFDAFEIGQSEYGRYFCRRCAQNGFVTHAEERYSMGVYAGMLCDSCWRGDGRNHARRFDPMDAGESLEEDA